MAVWSLLIWPFVIKSRICLDQHHLPSGIAEIKTIGIGVKISWQLLKTEKGIDFQIRYLRSHYRKNGSMKEMEQMRNRMGPIFLNAPYLKDNLISYFHSLHIVSTIRVGLGDAARTALACGALSMLLGCIPHAKGDIIPDFRNEVFHADIKCIAALQLGKLLLSAVLILRATAAQYIRRKVGGVVDG